MKKTCNVWLGNERNCEIIFLPHLNMNCNPKQFKILGVWFTSGLSKMAELNITDKFNETEKLFNIQAKHSITPLGRVAVLKSLILSKLVYLWIMLPNPPNNTTHKCNSCALNLYGTKLEIKEILHPQQQRRRHKYSLHQSLYFFSEINLDEKSL